MKTNSQPQGSTATNKASSQVLSPGKASPANVPDTYDSAKQNDIKIVIGYTGPPDAEGSGALLVLHSTAAMAPIAVQHLFTHFIWTIVDRLPKDFLGQGSTNIHELVSVQPQRRLDPSSSKSGMGRKLSHKKLTKFALRAERQDFGTFDDILLCLIPVFSIRDRLPNDATFKFDLPKLAERTTWPNAAPSYSALLRSIAKNPSSAIEDSLALTTVVYALDYIYMMALDEKHSQRDKPTNRKVGSTQKSADDEQDLLTLISESFPEAIKKLWFFYELQGRVEFSLKLKNSCPERIPKEMWSLQYNTQEKQAFMEHIRFSKLHQQIFDVKELDLGRLQGKEWETRDVIGWTALHYVAACRDLKVAGRNSADKAALSDGKRPENWWLDNFRRSPVHIACLTGNSNILDMLLTSMSENDVRSTIQSTGLDGMTPVHLAIAGRNKECLDVFLKLSYFFEIEFKDDAWKRSPVHLAIAQGQYECCAALLGNGELKFNPSALDTLGKSPLSYLNEEDKEQREIGRLLLRKYSSKFQEQDSEKKTVWHHAVRFLGRDRFVLHDDELLATLREKHKITIDTINKDQETPLHLAVRHKNDALVAELVSLEANLSINKDKHRSPLMLACSLGQLGAVEAMLDQGRRAVKDQDGKGRLALHYVVESKECNDDVRHKIMKRLFKAMKKADIKSMDVQDNSGCTPLHIATQNANGSAVSILLEAGADPSTKDKYDSNALHLALQSWRRDEQSAKPMQDITKKLLAKGPVCINASDYTGHTPLTWACILGKPLDFISQAVNLSKQKGSKFNLNQPDTDYGQSPLTWACEYGNEEVVKILLKSPSVDLSQKSTIDYTPLHFGLEEKNHEIIKMLVSNPKRRANINVASPGCPDILEFACRRSDKECIKLLLLHPEAKSPKFLTSGWKRAVKQPSRKESMAWFLHEWEEAILDPKNDVPFPLHELAEVGQLEKFRTLVRSDAFQDFDDNGWTPADVADRYGHDELAAYLRENEPARDLSEDPYVEPLTFVSLFKGPELESSKYIKLPKNDRIDVQFCYLRTKEAIPPNLDCFYFEVEILRSLQMKEYFVGFCQTDIPENRPPGWDEGSFAYHGDDGGFYVSNAGGDPQESDETFDEGDIVGCGLNFDTGRGYRTKNGVLLGSSYRFQDEEFSTGRFYPCIGAKANGEGDEFQIRTTLRSSPEHPFRFNGPYNGLLLRTEWDDDNLSVTSSS
ncbi:unnamed protein product [Fusarium langsethiae]|nr:unnamed protein product [Fusarium langsethiae]